MTQFKNHSLGRLSMVVLSDSCPQLPEPEHDGHNLQPLFAFITHIRAVKGFLLTLALVVLASGCRPQEPQPDPNRAYFEIHPLYKTMIVPVTINDTVSARLGFDTGGVFDMIDLDSAFCAAHPQHLWQQKPDAVLSRSWGVAWTRRQPQRGMLRYDKDFKVRIGGTNADYKRLTVWDRKSYFGENGQDGMFNMPVDTAHVWELNFEHNYIELHPTAAFTAPEGCLSVPIYINKPDRKLYATIPMKITASDGDTLTIRRDFLVDSGMGWDFAVVAPAEELSFFEGKRRVPFYCAEGYVDRHIVNATVFDDFRIDSLRIYTLKDRAYLRTSYLVGLNFLKRFNVFIDLGHGRMYLEPLKEFHRAFSPLWRYYCIDTSPTARGGLLVTDLADHEYNHYKKAGLRVGDEIVALGGVTLTPETTWEETAKLVDSPKVIIDIIRDGRPVRLVMERDPDEIQGD